MIPDFIKPFLWSYDIKKIDLIKNKKRIINNILNLGTKKATDWLFKNYRKEDIKEAVVNPLPGGFSEKSLNFWRLFFDLKKNNTEEYKKLRNRFIPEKIKIIFLFESPPKNNKYFYNEKESKNELLFMVMMKLINFNPENKLEGLKEFQKKDIF